jgi:hypothetical protein
VRLRLAEHAGKVLECADKGIGVARLSADDMHWLCPRCNAKGTCKPGCALNALLGALDELAALAPAARTPTVFDEIQAERARQDAKWGQQDHPSIPPILADRHPTRWCEEYEIPTEERAKFMCQTAAKRGECTFTHIAVEELSEAVECKDDAERRGELVQLAAVIVQWIQAIDRRAPAARKESDRG